jgi:hypothetical protein
MFYSSATDGTPLSPVEISPESVESSPSSPDPVESPTLIDEEKALNIANLIKNIEELGTDLDNTVSQSTLECKSSNQDESESSSILKSDDNAEKKEKSRSASTPFGPPSQFKRVDFAEETVEKKSVSIVDGPYMSRPTDLPLNEGMSPIPPQRSKSLKEKRRYERMLSVPNIKLSKLEANKLKDLRKPIASKMEKTSKNTFMRRFSKYQLCEISCAENFSNNSHYTQNALYHKKNPKNLF